MSSAQPVFAQSEADIAQARDLSRQAQEKYDAGQYAESEKLWIAAAKLYPLAPTLTLGLARTQAKLSKWVSAQENYNKIIREWKDNPNPPPAFKDALEAAKAEVGGMAAHFANVVITVDGPQNPNVTIDGVPMNAAALGLKRPVDPGHHKVHAEAPGWKPADAEFDVAEGATAEAKLKMEQDASVGVTTPPGGDQTTPSGGDKAGGSSNKTLAIVAFGVGGAGLVLGTITGLLAMGKHSDLEEACPEGKCTSDKQGDVDSYKTMGTLSTVGFIVAGVGAAAGAVLWFTAPKESASNKPATQVGFSPYVTVGGGGAGVTGRF